jgi:diguanylate cyclase (GGDEF)-like protein
MSGHTALTGLTLPRNAILPPLPVSALLLALASLASWLSLNFTAEHGSIATLWLMNGVVLGVMLRCPQAWWPGVLLLSGLGNILGGLGSTAPLGLRIALMSCNIIEICVAAWIVHRPGDVIQHFTERRSALRNCGGMLLAPLVSCVFAGLINTIVRHQPFTDTARIWLVAHALGLEIMTPLVLAFRKDELALLFARKTVARNIAALCILMAVSAGVFAQTQYPFLFMIFPPLVLVVFLTGFLGTSIALFAQSMIALIFTMSGHGPFMLMRDASPGLRIGIEQAYLLTTITLAMPLAIALAERRRFEAQLLSMQEQLKRMSLTDFLTGISNRRFFDEFTAREWKRACREKNSISAMMIDIDFFKGYNDTYGHHEGDKCLVAVAQAINGAASRPGDLTARYGDEEFVVVLGSTRPEGCLFLAERIRKSVESLGLPHASSPFGIVTVSIGMATMDATPDRSEIDLVEQADQALYDAKHQGRNRVGGATAAL